MDSILQHGFLDPRAPDHPAGCINGHAYGYGIYAGKTPTASLGYVRGDGLLVCGLAPNNTSVDHGSFYVVPDAADIVPLFRVTLAGCLARGPPLPLGGARRAATWLAPVAVLHDLRTGDVLFALGEPERSRSAMKVYRIAHHRRREAERRRGGWRAPPPAAA